MARPLHRCWKRICILLSTALIWQAGASDAMVALTLAPNASTQQRSSDAVLIALRDLAGPGHDSRLPAALLTAHEMLASEISAPASSLLALLHLFGLPGPTSASSVTVVKPVHVSEEDLVDAARQAGDGLSRDTLKAMRSIVKLRQAGHGDNAVRSVSLSLSGFILSAGHPEFTAATQFSFATGGLSMSFDSGALDRIDGNGVTVSDNVVGALDLPALAYFAAGQSGDVFGALAFTFYTMHGLSTEAARLAEKNMELRPGWPSLPRRPVPPEELDEFGVESAAFGARCRDSVNFLYKHATAAAKATDNDLADGALTRAAKHRVDMTGETQSELPRDTKEYADFIKQASENLDGDSMMEWGRIAYEGHYKMGKEPNQTEALEIWTAAAKRGHSRSAMLVVLLHVRGDLGDGDMQATTQYIDTALAAKSDVSPNQKALAHYLKYRFGIGLAADPVQAGNWLMRSAELGDVHAQMAIAAAHAGMQTIANVTFPNDVNGTLVVDDVKALQFWQMAARQGRLAASINAASHLLNATDSTSSSSAGDRCFQAYGLLRDVIIAGHPLVTTFHGLARRALDLDDLPGALLWYSFLSEVGSPIAARNAADLWARVQGPSTFEPVFPCVVNASGPPAAASVCVLFHLRRAAALGDIEAMHLASAAELVHGDRAAGYVWTDLAARRGDSRGIFERAMMHLRGEGPAASNRTAAFEDLWRLHAEGDIAARVASVLTFARLWAEIFWSFLCTHIAAIAAGAMTLIAAVIPAICFLCAARLVPVDLGG